MSKVYERITESITDWIARQHLFFVATAASSTDATVNVSPKAMAGTFAVVDDLTVAYLDLTGSGIETVAHLRENGRITLMWCAFEGPPRIVRIHGRGRVVTPDDAEWDDLLRRFEPHPGQRSIVVVSAERVSDACGYSVPKMDFVEERTRLDDWASSRSEEQLRTYRRQKNTTSIDGLPGL